MGLLSSVTKVFSVAATALTVAATFGTPWGWAAAAVGAYMQVSAQKASNAARRDRNRAAAEAAARAEAAKGLQVTVSDEVTSLAIAYGRVLIGGVRVYQNSFNNYISPPVIPGFYHFKASNALDNYISGSTHEFLITQQAIAVGGLSTCYVVDIDERKIDGEYVNDFNEVVFDGTGKFINPYGHGALVSVANLGGTADPVCYYNDAARVSSKFTHMAYATCVFRLNRDDPQFNGIPVVQFYAEGRGVKTVEVSSGMYILSSNLVYSNNPAYVLLDYLINPLYGRGLPLDQIDYESFYRAAVACDKIVIPNVPLEGKFWNAKKGVRHVRRAECNILIDTSQTIRDNIERILSVMDGALLIWSSGKYKLIVDYVTLYDNNTLYKSGEIAQYVKDGSPGLYICTGTMIGVSPDNNGPWKDYLSAYIYDTDIIRDDEGVVISWPSMQDRFNQCTVRFLNESKDFKEDTVTWPESGSYIHNIFLSQDSGIPLETEEFADGITAYYNAMARAESIVRRSRDKVLYEFSLGYEHIGLEPGDKIKLTSNVLNIPGELLNIVSVTPNENGLVKISAEKFDYSFFAWNVADTEYVPPRNIYETSVSNINLSDIIFHPISNETGKITWDYSDHARVVFYIVMTAPTNLGISTDWREYVRTSDRFAKLPDGYNSDYVVTVIPETAKGQRPLKSGWPIKQITYTKPDSVQSIGILQTSSGYKLYWSRINSNRISEYELRIGTDWLNSVYFGSSNTDELHIPFMEVGAYNIMVKAKDINGVYSVNPTSVQLQISTPQGVQISTNVIDNNVMLYWGDSLSQQPVDYYEIRKGAVYESSMLIGNISGLFSALFEVSSGQYRYWVTPVDKAGNKGVSNSVLAIVNQPPDFILRGSFSSALISAQYHTLTSSGTTPYEAYTSSDYFSADYIKTSQSMPSGSWLQQIHDMGEGSNLIIESSRVAVALDYFISSGNPVITVEISGSLNNSSYSTPIAGLEASLSNFRYIKVRTSISGGTIVLKGYEMSLFSKSIKKTGVVNCVASDTGGTLVDITGQFTDVVSINITPLGTTPLIAVYDFTDIPNPSSFKVLLFDTSGVRVSGVVSYAVEGVK